MVSQCITALEQRGSQVLVLREKPSGLSLVSFLSMRGVA